MFTLGLYSFQRTSMFINFLITYFFKLLATAGVATLGALGIAYFVNNINNEIKDNKEEIEALQTRYTKVKENYDDLNKEETNICNAVSAMQIRCYVFQCQLKNLDIHKTINVGVMFLILQFSCFTEVSGTTDGTTGANLIILDDLVKCGDPTCS